MLTTTYSTQTFGLEPIKITVEVDSIQGTPNLIIIGLPGKAIDESRERITAALINCDISPKSRRTIVNLAPANLHKSGSGLDLAICVGLLKLYKELPQTTDNTAYFGELSLDGSVKGVVEALPLVIAAQQLGFEKVVVPQENLAELSLIKNIEICAISHIKELLHSHKKKQPLPTTQPLPYQPQSHTSTLDFNHIIGQQTAKRALTIAAAGGHNIILIGAPGAGKSMLAQAMCSILPPLSETEALEVTRLHSLAGLTKTTGVITTRPFRQVHHTASEVAIIGGGKQLKPGEISLAHRGVLFLDELPEFRRTTIESLRQPLEDKTVTISRIAGTVQYPSDCVVVAAANPCPCGYHNTGVKECSCSLPDRLRYQDKLSGPILDRIDLHVMVPPIPTKKLAQHHTESSPTSKQIQDTIIQSRHIQTHRYQKPGFILNSNLTSQYIKKKGILSQQAEQLLLKATDALSLSARAYFNTIKVAQTIADLEAAEQGNHTKKSDRNITHHHVAEALQYRATVFA